MNDDVLHCSGLNGIPCGRYVVRVWGADHDWASRWDEPADRWVHQCPSCAQGASKARVRAAIVNGVRLGTRDMSPAERQVASEVLGKDLLEAVDGVWGEHRTPPMGTPAAARGPRP